VPGGFVFRMQLGVQASACASGLITFAGVQRWVRIALDKIRRVVVGAVPVSDDVRKQLFASYQMGDGSTRA